MPIVFLEINSLITFFLQNPSSSAVGIRRVVIDCGAVIPIQSPYFDTEHGLQTWIHTVLVWKNTKKRAKKTVKKGKKAAKNTNGISTIGLYVQVLDQKMVKKRPKLTWKQRIPRITTGILIICLHLSPKKKTFDTRDSRVVPHRSTDRAQWCLTSQFGWDAVYPPWCDRMMGRMVLSSMFPLYGSTNSDVNVSIIPPRTGPCWCSW